VRRARLAAVLREGLPLILLLSALSARALLLSTRHLFPVYDEIGYMADAREIAARGEWGTAACYLRGECRKDNRHPLYQMLAAPFIAGGPADYARVKLVTLATALLLVVCVYGLSRPLWGPGAALFAAGVVALSWRGADLASGVLADVLFSALFFAALAALAAGRNRRAGWLAFGVLAGLAYLAKGSAHLLLLAPLALAVVRARRGEAWRVELACAAGGFIAGGFLVLWRNTLVWHWPLHNFNDKVVWLDSWNQQWLLEARPERWARVGPLQYLRHHSLSEIAQRFGEGLVRTTALLFDTLNSQPFGAGTGFAGPVLLAASFAGLRLRWREGEREEVLVFGAVLAPLFLAHAWAYPAGVRGVRFMLPLVAGLAPFAALAARAAWRAAWAEAPFAARWRPAALTACACLAGLAATAGAAESFSLDPLALWAEPASWRDAGDWIKAHVPPGRIVTSSQSLFSVWDMPGGTSFACPLDLFDDDVRACVDGHKADFLMLDRDDFTFEQWPARFGPFDAYGPTSYLGWPRVYHDPGRPSRLLIFRRPRGAGPR
jgi:4-amino-4-deoxy-L-arabinose transferase-like glycosyltransferase